VQTGLERFIFLVAPIGYESKSSVVVAKDKDDAIKKACLHPAIEELLKTTSLTFATKNLNEQFQREGYNVSVTLKGIYH
jgi:tRNA C32,U32 (ribose-2'-O)-methylase TrmJ